MSRDAVCAALSRLYGIEPRSWDGLTLAELWQTLTLDQMNNVAEHLGVA
jgi:hypothetical protein